MPTTRTVRDQMIHDWAEAGIRRLEAHLAQHAAFEEYCRERGIAIPTDTTSSCRPTPHRS